GGGAARRRRVRPPAQRTPPRHRRRRPRLRGRPAHAASPGGAASLTSAAARAISFSYHRTHLRTALSLTPYRRPTALYPIAAISRLSRTYGGRSTLRVSGRGTPRSRLPLQATEQNRC